MKKKAGAFLLTILLAITTVAPVYAADYLNTLSIEYQPHYVDYVGDYYVSEKGLTCFCQFNSQQSITAGTALSNVTVMIISKSYPLTGSGTNGSGGNTGTGSTSTTYSASSIIYYCENEHSAPGIASTVITTYMY